jgi:hypothetical protein
MFTTASRWALSRTNWIHSHILLGFILTLFFHLLLFRRIPSDILFTPTSPDSFWYHPSIYIHFLWFILISVLPSMSLNSFFLYSFTCLHFLVLVLLLFLHPYLFRRIHSGVILPNVLFPSISGKRNIIFIKWWFWYLWLYHSIAAIWVQESRG